MAERNSHRKREKQSNGSVVKTYTIMWIFDMIKTLYNLSYA